MGDERAHRALVARLGVSRRCPECGSREHGQPASDRGAVSIAHAGASHLLALAAEPHGLDGPGLLGIDAEPVGAGEGIEPVALHRAERAVLGDLRGTDRSAEVLRVWVAKEAALKLIGSGVRVAPESFVARHVDGWYVEAGVLDVRRILITPVRLSGLEAMVATTAAPRITVRDERRN